MIDPLNLQNSGHDNSFGKDYKLCSKRVIDELFETGATLKQYPLRLLYIKEPVHFSKNTAFQIVISVPKKKILRSDNVSNVFKSDYNFSSI